MQKTIRPGTHADVTWITRLLQAGASGGHFSPTVGVQALALLRATLDVGGFHMLRHRNGTSAQVFISAQLIVAELDGRPASFLLTLVDTDEVELHLAGTIQEFKRNGCFHELSKAVITEHAQKTRIFARCYKKSSWAQAGLIKLGFVKCAANDPVELEFRLR